MPELAVERGVGSFAAIFCFLTGAMLDDALTLLLERGDATALPPLDITAAFFF
jgi:hypothetical protein